MLIRVYDVALMTCQAQCRSPTTSAVKRTPAARNAA